MSADKGTWAEAASSEPWWMGLGVEQLTSAERCSVEECTRETSPVAVFCPEINHGDLLLFQDAPVGRTRWWLVNTARSVVVGLVVAAAAYATPWPIYLLAVFAGLACIGLPLHAHRRARTIGLAGWAVISAVTAVAAAADVGTDGMQAVWTAGVALPLATALLFGLQGPMVLSGDDAPGAEREAARGAAGSYALAVVMATAWWLISGTLADRFVAIPAAVSRWLLFGAVGTALGAALIAAVGAFLVSFGQLDLWVDPRFDPDEFPERRTSPATYTRKEQRPGRGRSTALAQMLRQFEILRHELREQLKKSLTALRRTTADGLWAFLWAAQIAALRVVNWLDRRIRLFGRRVYFVVRRGIAIAWTGAGYALEAAGCGIRPLAAYGAAIGGAVAALALADGFTDYLVDGPIDGLVSGVAWSCVGVGACFAVWERLSSVDTSAALHSELRFLSRVAPDVALFTVAAGWVVGIPGMFGYGPIRVGWVTLVGTAVLAVLLAQEELSERRSSKHPEPAGSQA